MQTVSYSWKISPSPNRSKHLVFKSFHYFNSTAVQHAMTGFPMYFLAKHKPIFYAIARVIYMIHKYNRAHCYHILGKRKSKFTTQCFRSSMPVHTHIPVYTIYTSAIFNSLFLDIWTLCSLASSDFQILLRLPETYLYTIHQTHRELTAQIYK